MNLRRRLKKIEEALKPPPLRIIGATVDSRTNTLRSILTSDGKGTMDPPPGLRVEDLPEDCFVQHYDSSREGVMLFKATDGTVGMTCWCGIDLDIVLGRKPCPKTPEEWAALGERLGVTP